MKKFILCLALVCMTAPLPAQTLALSLPADTLVYFRSRGSFDDLSKMMGAGGLWQSPFSMDAVMGQLDEGLSFVEGMFDFEGGSLSGYIKSIQSVEGALYRLELTDDIPELDFALVLQLPEADELYKLLSGALVKQAMGEMNQEGELEISTDFIGLNVAVRDDKIVIASDQRRLRDTMASFGKVRPGSLGQTADFKFVVGGTEPKALLYGRVQYFIRMAIENFTRGGEQVIAVAARKFFGVDKIRCVGFMETETSSRAVLKASAPIPFLQVFAGSPGTPELLEKMPSEVGFGVVYAGNLESSWQKASQVLLSEDSPVAPFVEQGIREMQKETGLKPEDLARLAKGGFAVGMIPDKYGRLDDDEGMFFSMRFENAEKPLEYARQYLPMMAEKSRMQLEERAEGNTTWFLMKRSSGRLEACLCVAGKYAAVGPKEEAIRKVMDALHGNRPNLKSSGSLKGLKPKAEGYFYLGLRAIMANESSFAPALTRIKDNASIAASVTVRDDSAVLETNRPVSEVVTAFSMAQAYYESVKKQRNVHRDNLRKIGEAYKKYVEQHGKAPKTLVDLGFTGEKALKGPVVDGKQAKGVDLYVIMPPSPSEENSWNHIRAYCKDGSYGRMILNKNGYAYSTSDARFRRQLDRQKAEATASQPEKKD